LLGQYDETSFTTGVGGIIAAAIQYGNPSGATGWSSYGTVFDEYRTLATSVSYCPSDRYDQSAGVSTKGVIVVVDHDDITPLSTNAGAAGYASAQLMSLTDPWTKEIKMETVEDATFRSCTVTTGTGSIKAYMSGLAVSTFYGGILIRHLIQFRGAF